MLYCGKSIWLLLSCVGCLIGILDAKSLVIDLNDDNFDQLIHNGVWFVQFTIPAAPRNDELAPKWEQVAKDLKGKASVARVNVEACPKLKDRFALVEYPQMFVIHEERMYKYIHPAWEARIMVGYATSGFISMKENAQLCEGPKIPEDFDPDACSTVLQAIRDLPPADDDEEDAGPGDDEEQGGSLSDEL